MQGGQVSEKKSAWLLGVCGMGVGPLAVYMRGEGWDVSGWDDAADSPMLPFLEKAGVRLTPKRCASAFSLKGSPGL